MGFLNGFCETVKHGLRHLELRPAVCTDLFLGCQGLRNTDAGNLFGLCFRQGADLGSLLDGALLICLALVAQHIDAQLGLCDAGLHLGAGLGLLELAFLDGGLLLAIIGLDLL